LTAGHAFAAATLDGQTTAADLGQRWLSPARRRLATSLQVREDIAACLEGQRRFDAAERELTIALGHAPENPELLLRLGVVQAERGENRSAERTLLAVTRIIPSSPDPWRDLALLYRQDDRSADAAAADAQAHRLTGHR
jgi:Flp pilus assembly protein TadD